MLIAADEVGRTANTLRTEVTDFLAAMSSGNDDERRRYERGPGKGAKASLRVPGRAEIETGIVDISRGGVSLKYAGTGQAGTDVTVILPGRNDLVPARIVRAANGMVGLIFRQDAASTARVDEAIELIAKLATREAA